MPLHAHGAGLQAVGQHLDLLAFLTLGVLGSAAHCVGMCSPFVLLVSRRYGPPGGGHGPVAAQLWYNTGRIVTYAALGALAGAFGGVVQMAGALVGVQRTAAVVAGAALVVSALVSLFALSTRAPAPSAWFGRVFARFKGRVPGHPLALGLFLGLLPCGLLYSAVVAAVARGGPLEGATALAIFGLGTAPALLGLSLADALFLRHRVVMNRFSHVFVLVMGVWFLWRGLALGSVR